MTYVDPNPPEIKVLNVYALSGNTTQDADGNYLLNPEESLNIEVSAVDPDGDEVTYDFTAEDGEFTATDTKAGKATWKAPNYGGTFTITVKAKSNTRTTTKDIIVKVNHYPEITVISPDESEITDEKNPKEYKANEEVIINTIITDAEDDIGNLTIKWFSDLQGEIGSGENLKKILIPGTHTITLEVTDSKGLKTVKTFYVKVKPMDLVWLKAPDAGLIKLYTTEDGIPLQTTYQIPIGTTDKTLKYESLDESVATVDGNGTITAVSPGTTKIRVYSQEEDENGNPLYEFYITVRVIGKLTADENGTYKLGVGQIYQVKVDKTYTIKLTGLVEGKYEVLIFDDKNIIDGSYTRSEIYADGYRNSYADGNTYHQIEVLDRDTNYELKLIPENSNWGYQGKEYVKIALFPGYDVYDDNGTLLKSVAWDGNSLEPNDVKATAYEIKLGQTIYSDINIWKHDYADWYRVYLNKGYYEVKFQTLSGTNTDWDNDIYFKIYDPTGTEISSHCIQHGIGWTNFSFEAKNTGTYFIKIYSDENKNAYYRFIIYPSIANGLKQDAYGEPNDFSFMATPIELLKEVRGKVGFGTDHADWYELKNLEAGKTYTIRLDTLSGTESSYGDNTWLLVYDPTGKQIASGSIDGDCTNCRTWFDFTAIEDGNYKIKVYRENNYDTYYAFEVYPSVENGLKQDANFEPNNTPNLATPISLGDEIENWVGVGKDTVDYYKLLNFPGPGTYLIELSALQGTEHELYWDTLVLQISSAVCDFRYVTHSTTASKTCEVTLPEGEHIIKVYRENNYDTHYKFRIYKKEE
jgi:hypothetical protein